MLAVLGAIAYLSIEKPWVSKPVTASAVAFAPPSHSVAVLPFVNMSGDKEQEYFSDGLTEATVLPPMAIRMIKLGEETGQLPALAGRVAEFYEAKLQRSLDRMVAIVGPVAIITISVVVGGLIVSVMTALLSVTQIIG